MAKRTAQKRKAVGFTAANGRTPKAFEASQVKTFERPDVLILLGLAVVTFGIYAQVIGHRFITIDNLSYLNVVLRLPPCQHDKRQVLIWIDAIHGRSDHHSGPPAMS